MPDQPLITVRGEASLEVPAEIARFTVAVLAKHPDRTTVLSRLNERGSAVQAILDAHRDAIEDMETTAIQVSPIIDYGKSRERVLGYRAGLRHTIAVTDFDRLGELLARLADQELTEVAGPWWALRPDSPVHDAVRRAREYADALGGELTGLIELTDGQVRSEPPVRFAASRMMAPGQQAEPEFSFELSPARQTVSAAVEARFRMTEPDLAGGSQPRSSDITDPESADGIRG